jgi:hypothetical protein
VSAHLTDDELCTLIRVSAKELDSGGTATLGAVANRFRAVVPAGTPHRGKKDMSRREVLEWYAGELVDISEQRAYFAVNSWLNCIDKFAPEVSP